MQPQIKIKTLRQSQFMNQFKIFKDELRYENEQRMQQQTTHYPCGQIGRCVNCCQYPSFAPNASDHRSAITQMNCGAPANGNVNALPFIKVENNYGSLYRNALAPMPSSFPSRNVLTPLARKASVTVNSQHCYNSQIGTQGLPMRWATQGDLPPPLSPLTPQVMANAISPLLINPGQTLEYNLTIQPVQRLP